MKAASLLRHVPGPKDPKDPHNRASVFHQKMHARATGHLRANLPRRVAPGSQAGREINGQDIHLHHSDHNNPDSNRDRDRHPNRPHNDPALPGNFARMNRNITRARARRHSGDTRHSHDEARTGQDGASAQRC